MSEPPLPFRALRFDSLSHFPFLIPLLLAGTAGGKQLAGHELDFIALSHFNQVGHGNEQRIFIFFGREETKDKSGYGGVITGRT